MAIGKYSVPKLPAGIPINDKIVLFAIDSCNKGNATVATNAIGELGYQQLERFARELYKYRDKPVKIAILHHSPNIPKDSTAKNRGLEDMSYFERWGLEMPKEDRRAFRLLCVAHKVRLVLHGHLHRAEDRRVNGVRYIGAPASTQPKNGKYQFYTYTVSNSGKKVTAKLVSI